MKFSKQYLQQAKNLIKPKDFFETLAEEGFLNDYINDFFYDKYKNDEKFRERILLLKAEYSNEPVEDIDLEYLNELSKALSKFISKTKNDRI